MSDIKKYSILYVDDEPKALKYFRPVFEDDFSILTATSAEEGWGIIEERSEEIGILMTDQRMPGTKGVELLERVQQKYPKIIRILVTAFSDLEEAIAAVNSGAIYKYIKKPWDIIELRITLRRALEFFAIAKERDGLLYEKLSVLEHMLLTDRAKNLALFAAGLTPVLHNQLAAVRAFFSQIPSSSLPRDLDIIAQQSDLFQCMELESEQFFNLIGSLKHLIDETKTELDEPASVREILESIPVVSDGYSMRFEGELPPVQVNRKQVLKVVELLIQAFKGVLGEGARFDVQVQPSDQNGNSVDLKFSSNGAGWSSDQALQFYAPFISGSNVNKQYGWDLLKCFMLIYHHNGRIQIENGHSNSITLNLPCNPPPPDDDRNERDIFHDLFCMNQSLDGYYAL